jgi:hypothetical protein
MTVRACLSLRCMRARVCAGSCSDSDENEDDIDQGDSRSSRSLQGGKQPQRSLSTSLPLVPTVLSLLAASGGRGA